MFSGTRKAVCAGEEVPSFNRRAELPEAQQQHPGGEQSTPPSNPGNILPSSSFNSAELLTGLSTHQ